MTNRTTTTANTLTNTNTNTNSSTNNFGNRFIALAVALELIEALAPVVPAIERHNRALADQLFRAASSVPMNLAEGQRSQKGNQQKHYAIAHGSANEVKAALHVARAWGWIDQSDSALVVMDRLLALLWRLTHRKPRG
jgi:four helix bundle protein